MGFEKEKMKQIRGLILFVAVIVLGLRYSDTVFKAISMCIGIFKPFIYGGVIAFILNIPLRAIEHKMFARWKGKSAEKLKRPLGIVLSILFVVALFTVVVITVVPQIGKTVVDLGNRIPVFAENVMIQVEILATQYPQLETYFADVNIMQMDWNAILDGVINFLTTGVSSVLTSTFTVASSIVGGVMNGVVGVIFALYILGQKETLARQAKSVLHAYLKQKHYDSVVKVLGMLYQNFYNFITGQCLEAVILGALFVVAMTIFGMPYAILVGVLIAFTALIPIVGAFIGCFVGAFLIMVNDPMQAVVFVVMFLVIQQLEGNLIYPRVVGNKVGLPAIWVLMAVSVGGSLFGVAGMLVFIPLISTFYALLRDGVREREKQKQKKNQRYNNPNYHNKKKYEAKKDSKQPKNADK